MKLSLSSKATRAVEDIRDAIAAGRFVRAIQLACDLLGDRHVPEVKVPVRFKARLVEPPTIPEGPDETYSTARERALHDRIRPQPKPTHRYVAKDRVAEFRALYTRCCILGCEETDADPHHWWARGLGGPDEHALLSPLGRRHHDEAEHLGREAFCAKYASRMAPIDLLKARLAGMMQDQAKLGLRDVIDRDAETEERA